jgi:ketosteroid isomerase-like protein
MSDPERNKRLLREQREASQRGALPSALPDAGAFALQNPLSGYLPASVMVSNDPPSPNPQDFEAAAKGFPSQALGPTFLSYGPMVAEGDVVVEEWESHIFGGDGTLYNNQYCWILRFEDDRVVAMREYNDTHHAALIFGRHGGWEDPPPPTEPRRRNRHGDPALGASELEDVFEVVDRFELDPRLLADVVPSPGRPPMTVEPGPEGNKALVRALRRARAAGDPELVGTFYAEGFRHFSAGERPFGWDHLPLEEIYAPLVEHLASPLTVRYGPPIADGDIVVEEMDIFARLDDGTVYNNWHCIFHDIRDGKIVQTREYLDTRHVWIALGRWAPWAATPVPPRTKPRRSNLQGIAMSTQTPTMFMDLERWQPFDPPG